jgi:hypothetical protein
VLELVVEADVVHLLEDLEIVLLDDNWTRAASTDGRRVHSSILPAEPGTCSNTAQWVGFRAVAGWFKGGKSRLQAIEWMRRGASLLDTDVAEAERCYRKAVTLDPQLYPAWFDLGLIYKRGRDWQRCLACNRRGVPELVSEQEKGDPAFWNAGIAATALRDWRSARWAWSGFGIQVDDGDGPVNMDFGLGVVRLPVGETLWGRRIDPARMRLLSIPLPDSGFRYGDIVLHDGEPKGKRVANGYEYSVFDMIDRWEASPVPTVEVVLDCTGSLVDELVSALDGSGVVAENWTTSVQVLCLACSHGRVDYESPEHHHAPPTATRSKRLGCSGRLADVETIVSSWSAAQTGVRVEAIHEVA